MSEPQLINLQMIQNLWIELHHDANDARDVIVQFEDGSIFTALFVTPEYLMRQMELTFQLAQQIPDAVPVRFVALDTPHVLLERLDRDLIEDTIDTLMAMDTFGSLFTRVTETPDEVEQPETTIGGRRATQEVAAVVLQDVLFVE
jgi:hypothetical protein